MVDIGTVIALIGLAVAVAFGVVGVLFGLAQRSSAKEIKRDLNAVLELHREMRPDAAERLAAEAAPTARREVDREAIADVIARLPEREKLIVTLYYYEQLTQTEIAQMLGISQSRVSQLLARAITRIRAQLSDST